MTEWSWCLLPAGMKWRLAAFPPDPQIIMQKKNKNHRISAGDTWTQYVQPPLPLLAFAKRCLLTRLFSRAMCLTKRDRMYNIWCTVPPVCLPPQRLLPHTSVRVYPPGLGNVWNLTFTTTMLCVCCSAVLPTPRHSSRPLPAATKTASADLFADAEPAGKKRSFGTRG